MLTTREPRQRAGIRLWEAVECNTTMTSEHKGRHIPDWAKEERASDLAWIAENRSSFWPAAQAQFTAQGRGVIVVDTTVQPDPNAGNPMYYLPQEMAEQTDDEDTKRMLREYDPHQEF